MQDISWWHPTIYRALTAIASFLLAAGAAGAGNKPVLSWQQTNRAALSYPSVAISPNGRFIACGGFATLRLMEARSGKLIAFAHFRPRELYCPLYAMDWSPDSSTLASGDAEGGLRFWDIRRGTAIRNVPNAHRGPVRCVRWSHDGRIVASGGDDGWIRFWDASTAKAVQPVALRLIKPRGIAFTPDGKLLAAAGGDGFVTLWDWRKAAKTKSWKAHTGLIYGFAMSEDGKQLATSKTSIRIWDRATGREVATIKPTDPPFLGLTFAGGGRLLCFGDLKGCVSGWHIDRRQIAFRSPPARQVLSLDSQRRGELLVASGIGATIRVWRLARPATPSQGKGPPSLKEGGP